ncbi:MAG: hypothetical protein CL607_23730 [Anaerolineaceae bacterium]|nr:hypothetical protein [Anaerolineaceae bacterium]|tara:strand:- start:246 stop:548 length:303 start_codon:yes stop_codon:yes gene_type:complete
MAQYILSPNAQASLRAIKSYSLNQFGEQQTRIYLQLIATRLQAIAEEPEIGRSRDEIKQGYLSFLAGSHVIFYRKGQGHIDIIDILHQSMEPHLHLYDEE